MSRGPSSAERQRAAFGQRGSLIDVVDLVIDELGTIDPSEVASP